MTDMDSKEKQTTDQNLQGVLSKKFGNDLTANELVEMEDSLLELCKLLFDNYIEQEGVKFNESNIVSKSFHRNAGRWFLIGSPIRKVERVLL